ncbi:hypothetical protein ACP3V3_02620 [Vibrio sp. PNB22_3_1]
MNQNLHLIIKTTSPMHIPDASVSTASGTATPTTRELYKAGNETYFEVAIGSNGLRGRLRRAIADMYSNRLADVGLTLSSDAARGFLNSKATGVPSSESATIEMINKSLEHPFVGLLGGGKYLLNSKLSVGSINLVSERNVQNGYVPEAFSSMAISEGQRLTKRFTKISKDSTIDGSVFDGLRRVVDNYDIELEAWRELIAINKSERESSKDAMDNEELKAAKEQALAEIKAKLLVDLKPDAKDLAMQLLKKKGGDITEAAITKTTTQELNKLVKKALADIEKTSKKLDTQNMMEVETVASGVEFHSHITNKERELNDTQIGLLLLGLVEVGKRFNFGINGSIGHGRFVLALYNEEQELLLSYNPDILEYEFSESVQDYLDKAESHLENLDKSSVDLIEAVYGR